MRKVPDVPTNDPDDFRKLPLEKQQHVLSWISDNLVQINTFNTKHHSGNLRSVYQNWFPKEDRYLTNDEFKGAMDAAGFEYRVKKCDSTLCDYWEFKISEKSPAFNTKD